jgi:hypothetical protein
MASAEPVSVLKAQPSKRFTVNARRSSLARSFDDSAIRGNGQYDEDYKRFRERSKGLLLPPVEVGIQQEIRKVPQQPVWQNRAAMTVEPDTQLRSTIPKVSADDQPPYPSQGAGPDNSLRPGSICITTPRLMKKGLNTHTHDRRLPVTRSPSGLPPSELHGMIPVGILSRGQQFNAYEPDAFTRSDELSMDLTGVHAGTNRSGMRILPGTPLGVSLPRRIVPSDEDKQKYLAGGNIIPTPAVKNIENIRNEFECELVPIPMNIFHRMHEAVLSPEVAAWRLGFMAMDATRKARVSDYNPEECLEKLRDLVHADLDRGRSYGILESEGVDAMLCYRMLSTAIALAFRSDKAEAKAWAENAEKTIVSAAKRNISLAQFVDGRKGEAGMVDHGARELLKMYKDSMSGVAGATVIDLNDTLRFAAGGMNAAMGLWMVCSQQVSQQIMGGIFAIAIGPSPNGGDLEFNRV